DVFASLGVLEDRPPTFDHHQRVLVVLRVVQRVNEMLLVLSDKHIEPFHRRTAFAGMSRRDTTSPGAAFPLRLASHRSAVDPGELAVNSSACSSDLPGRSAAIARRPCAADVSRAGEEAPPAPRTHSGTPCPRRTPGRWRCSSS